MTASSGSMIDLWDCVPNTEDIERVRAMQPGLWVTAFRSFLQIMRSTTGHAQVLWRMEIESLCGPSGSSSCACLLPGGPCPEVETTRLTDHMHPAKNLFLTLKLCVARVDHDSGSRKPGLVDEDEADACLSLRSTFGMRFEPSETATLRYSRTPVSVSRNDRQLDLPVSAFWARVARCVTTPPFVDS